MSKEVFSLTLDSNMSESFEEFNLIKGFIFPVDIFVDRPRNAATPTRAHL